MKKTKQRKTDNSKKNKLTLKNIYHTCIDLLVKAPELKNDKKDILRVLINIVRNAIEFSIFAFLAFGIIFYVDHWADMRASRIEDKANTYTATLLKHSHPSHGPKNYSDGDALIYVEETSYKGWIHFSNELSYLENGNTYTVYEYKGTYAFFLDDLAVNSSILRFVFTRGGLFLVVLCLMPCFISTFLILADIIILIAMLIGALRKPR